MMKKVLFLYLQKTRLEQQKKKKKKHLEDPHVSEASSNDNKRVGA